MVIYKAEFPNGKVYIGKTTTDFEVRRKRHKYSVKHKTKMGYAIRKYGFDSIKWEIIDTADNEDDLNLKEKFHIKEYNSIHGGYNIAEGGSGGNTISHNKNRLKIIKKLLLSSGYDPNKYIVIDKELSSKIIENYVFDKMSIKQLVRTYKISKNRITRFLKSENVPIDPNRCVLTNSCKIEKEITPKVIEMYGLNKSIKSTASELGLTIMIVSRILHDNEIRKSSRFRNGRRYDGIQPKRLQNFDS